MSKTTFTIVAYDIPSDKRRTKIHKLLCGFGKSTQFSLNELNRGTHRLQVSVVDAQGSTLISSSTTTFHLRKASIIKP